MGKISQGKYQNPDITDIIIRNNNISKFKFRCIKGYEEEIYKNHYETDCIINMSK